MKAPVWGSKLIYGSGPRWDSFFYYFTNNNYVNYDNYIMYTFLVFDSLVIYRYAVTSCTHWWEVEASMVVLMPLMIEKSSRGDVGPLGIYPILSALPDYFARFLFEFHAVRFESLDLLPLPADRSDFDVHGALEDDKVETKYCPILCVREEI